MLTLAAGLIDWVAAVDVLAEGWGEQRVESMKSKELLLALQPAGVLWMRVLCCCRVQVDVVE